MGNVRRTILLTLAVIFAPAAVAPAAVLFQHAGSADPVSEGWSLQGGPSTLTGTPITGDVGGYDAWGINDNSTTASLAYFRGQNQQVHELGWTLRARLRIVDSPLNPNDGPTIGYRDNLGGNSLQFGAEADGDPIVLLGTKQTTVTYVLDGGAGQHHLFEMIHHGGSTTNEFWIDGVKRQDYEPFMLAIAAVIVPPRVSWGTMGSSALGNVNYNLIQFEVLPEPSLTLLIPLLFLTRSPRRSRSRTPNPLISSSPPAAP